MADIPSDAASELAERHAATARGHGDRHDRLISIAEAIMLSVVALVAAWSGYCAASWGTRSNDLLTQSSETQVAAQAATQEGLQIRTFDSVAFDAVFSAYVVNDRPAFRLALRRLLPEYREAFNAWLALRPLKNPAAPADPSKMPQYRIVQEARGRVLTVKAHRLFAQAGKAGTTSDDYVRLTVILASVLFLLGISGHFPVRSARYGLLTIAGVLIAYSLVQVVTLPGPP